VALSPTGDVVADRPDSIFYWAAFSESPETVVPTSDGLGSLAAETPGFASPDSVRPPAAPDMSMSSAPPAQKGSGKLSSLVAACSLCQQEESTTIIVKHCFCLLSTVSCV
jgi:crossover junction endonuclease EME1